jgi:hypothetical protein
VVDDAADLVVAALERLGVHELLDQLGRAGADDVAADQLAVLLVADDLDHAAAVAVDGAGADRAVVDLADDDVEALLLRLLLGEAERADVGRAERRARDVDVLDRVRLHPGGVLDGDDALVGRLVGERGAAYEVADRIDALDVRAERAVDVDHAAVVELDARLLEPEALDVGAAAGGDHEPVDLSGLVAVLEADLVVAGLDVLDLGTGVDVDALLAQPAPDDLGDLGVLGRDDTVEGLEQHHLRAEARVGGGDLDTRRARAGHDHRLRQILERPRLLGADHAAAELGAGDRLGDRAGGEDDRLLRLDLGAVEVAADLHVAVVGDGGVALDVVDLVLLEQAGDAAGKGLDDLLAARHDLGEVDAALRHGDAEVLGLVDLGQHVGDAQDGLGGDAGVVEAAAPDDVSLDDGGLHAELRGTDGGHVAARSRADDDDVVGGVRHGERT